MSQCSSTGTSSYTLLCYPNERAAPIIRFIIEFQMHTVRGNSWSVCFLMRLDDHDQFACHCTLRLEKIVPRGMSWHRYW
ncbi:hypothetical protein CY34DRAFT_809379 [Suillus luteus UH-Slu-Lm8-n1]|uniref:Uncharacterized protein n=1 Tax=Suillus luteus UH-Slu-Lm8-n1 TaxID=930992 RepID=A0A0D0AVJ2_9AGAM|nr:hypothetical protein CY34DRAFT_809379 [Suillus luteus UH-Slu-Lm8-n1]